MSHARLSPSGSPRWTKCTGSVALEDQCPDSTSIYAARGTLKHEMAEKVLTGGITVESRYQPGDTFEIDGHSITLEAADLDHVSEYVYFVRAVKQDHPDSKLMIEQKLDMGEFIPGSWGTADAVLVVPFDKVIVIDAKFGAGVKVGADSTQLACYGAAAWQKWGPDYGLETVEVVVMQPPLKHVDNKIYDLQEMQGFVDWIKPLALEAHSGNGTSLATGDHCRFCRAKGICPEFSKVAQKAAKTAFADDTAPTLSERLGMLDALKAYIKDTEQEALKTLAAGDPVPGYKLVEGRRSRVWCDVHEVERYLRGKNVKVKDMFVQTLRSPAQMEKMAKAYMSQAGMKSRLDLASFIEVKPGKPTLAPESDKRRAIKPAVLAFENTLLD